MAVTIQVKRGPKAALPTLAAGEWGLATDTGEVFIGNAGGNVQLPTVSDGGKLPAEQVTIATQSAVGVVKPGENRTVDSAGALTGSFMPLSGGTLTGAAVAMASPVETDAQLRNVVVVASTVTDEEIAALPVPYGTIVFREEE